MSRGVFRPKFTSTILFEAFFLSADISNPGSQDLVTEVFLEQASAVQEAGAVACIIINMVGARKIRKQVKIIRFNIEIEIFT
jgi:hypothetical protein